MDFDTYVSSGYLASPIDLDDIAIEVTLLAAHFRDHVDPALVVYFELSNEIWNTLFDQFHWFSAQGKQALRARRLRDMRCLVILRHTV